MLFNIISYKLICIKIPREQQIECLRVTDNIPCFDPLAGLHLIIINIMSIISWP